MATLQTDEANIIDAEETNWRLVVYPVLIVLIVGFGALGYYYYLQNQRNQTEATARAALVQATTPEEFLKVAADYPHTDQAMLATLRAADASFDKRDFDGALSAYRTVSENTALSQEWRDTAELGMASAYEANGKIDQAVSSFLDVARHGDKSPFAGYAYVAVARIDEQRGDKDGERQVLQSAAALDPDSTFTKMAQNKLKELNAAANPMTVNVPATPAASVPSAPAPSVPAPTPPTK